MRPQKVPQPQLVIASNRGPVAVGKAPDGTLYPKRVSGGLATSLIGALRDTGATWLATTPEGLSEHDEYRDFTFDGFRVVHHDIDPVQYRQYYDVISNGTLWFLHHSLFDLARRPYLDRHWWDAWHAYCEVNDSFASHLAEIAPLHSVVLVHDYHLALVGKSLRALRPDLRLVHFVHTPFASVGSITTLPRPVLSKLLESMSSYDACGFHTQMWAESFALCCASITGRTPRTFISSPTPSAHELETEAASELVAEESEALEDLIGDRKVIVRVDRMELSKNLLRGFSAYDDFLQRYPRWRERVVFFAQLYPSREGLAEYKAYRNEVQGLVGQINERWRTPDWTPIELRVVDNFARSLAAYLRYDVLLVNPIRDGLNLVAKEGALLNKTDGVIVLSRETGAWRELGQGALGINPFDILGTADALVAALEMDPEERQIRAARLDRAARLRTPQDWLNDQVAAGYDH